jgi:PAS domain S-box-containing protein
MTAAQLEPATLHRLLDRYMATTGDTVIITNSALRPPGPIIEYVNAALLKLTGRPEAELIGGPLATLYNTETFPPVLAQLAEIAEDPRPVLTDAMTIDRTGNPVWLEVNTVPIVDGKGRLTHFVRFSRQITTRKRIEQQREVTQHLLASVFGVIDQALGVVDDLGRFSMVNTALTRQLGWSVFELIGKPFTAVIEPASRTSLIGALDAGEELSQTRRLQTQLLKRDGRIVPGEIVATNIQQPDGKQYRVITVLPKASVEPPKAATGKTESGAPLQGAIHELLARQGSPAEFVGGKFQLIGLAEVREALGEKWRETSAGVFALAERVLRRHLSQKDTTLRTADDGFLVCFDELGEVEAQAKAKVITDEIRAALGSVAPEMERAAVSGFTAKVSINSTEAGSEDGIIEALEGRFARERKRLENGALESLRNGLATVELQFQRVRTETNQVAPFTMMRLPRPLETALETIQALGRADYGVEAELALLTGAAERLLSELTQTRTDSCSVPVRMSTLLQRRDAERWLQIARSMAQPGRKRLTIEITGLQRDTARSRMTDLVMMIATLCKGVAYELPVADPAFVAGLPQAIQLATISAPRLSSDSNAGAPAAAVKLMSVLRNRNCRLLVKQVPSATQAMALAKSGISLILTQQELGQGG